MGFLRLIRRVPSKICRAAREGDVLLLRSILKKHPQAANFICDEGWSPLMLGAGIRDHDSASSTCKLLLDAGADVHYQNAHGISALHVAAKWGHYILTALILLKGANPNISTSGGVTPLHLAAGTLYSDLGRSECCTTVMELLLDNGAEIDTVDFSGNTALHYAVEIGHTEIVRLLTSKGAEVDTVGHSGNTVLHYAVERGHTEIVRLLMSNGADPLIRNIKDYTPLYLSVVAGECDTTKVLIDCGAEVNPSCRKEGNQRPLHVVAKTSNVEIAKLLLASNADINAIDDSGYTPLQYAFENDPWVDDVDSEHSMVGLLKRHGAKLGDVSEDLFEAVESSNLKNTKMILNLYPGMVNVRDESNLTLLHKAVQLSNRAIVEWLLVAGADVNASTSAIDITPLHIAAANGSTEIVSALLLSGAEVEACTSMGDTPLHIAAENGNTDVAVLLVEHGAQINSRGAIGVTPLHCTAYNGQVDLFELLMIRGADVHATSLIKRTVVHYAAEQGNDQIITQLKNFDLDFCAPDMLEMTPIKLAEKNGHQSTVELLQSIVSQFRRSKTSERKHVRKRD